MITGALNEWITTLPPFEDTGPQLRVTSQAGETYLLEWNSNKAALKLFRDEGISTPGQRAKDRASAEAEGLRIFASRGLAPQLIWEGNLPGEMGGYAVIRGWANGTNLCDSPSGSDIDLYADALFRIHSERTALKILSPNPRNLETWWIRTHEAYRDLHAGLLQEEPPTLSDTLGRLIQSVAGDAQAHKRFWQGAPLVPVHGSPTCDNLILNGGQVMLVDWQRFGLGDPAYELALAASQYHDQASAQQRMTDTYLEKADEIMLNRRVQIYMRLLPFSRIMSLLSSADVRSSARASDLIANLRTGMETYGWSPPDVGAALDATQAWIDKLQTQTESSHVRAD